MLICSYSRTLKFKLLWFFKFGRETLIFPAVVLTSTIYSVTQIVSMNYTKFWNNMSVCLKKINNNVAVVVPEAVSQIAEFEFEVSLGFFFINKYLKNLIQIPYCFLSLFKLEFLFFWKFVTKYTNFWIVYYQIWKF